MGKINPIEKFPLNALFNVFNSYHEQYNCKIECSLIEKDYYVEITFFINGSLALEYKRLYQSKNDYMTSRGRNNSPITILDEKSLINYINYLFNEDEEFCDFMSTQITKSLNKDVDLKLFATFLGE